jgi:hypothetical protein
LLPLRQGHFLPVHFAAAFFGSKAVCERLHEVYPEGTRTFSHLGSLPLHLAAHNGQRDAAGVLWAAYPEAAELEDGWGFTPTDLAWRNGHWEIVDFLESESGVAPKEATASGEVVAPYDPSTPQEADLVRQQYADILKAVDLCKSLPPADASGLPRPGEAGFVQREEYMRQQERWRAAAADLPQRLAVELWVAHHPDSFLAKKLARQPALALQWRRQVSRHVEWLKEQGQPSRA